jgi:hypothetical protein
VFCCLVTSKQHSFDLNFDTGAEPVHTISVIGDLLLIVSPNEWNDKCCSGVKGFFFPVVSNCESCPRHVSKKIHNNISLLSNKANTQTHTQATTSERSRGKNNSYSLFLWFTHPITISNREDTNQKLNRIH